MIGLIVREIKLPREKLNKAVGLYGIHFMLGILQVKNKLQLDFTARYSKYDAEDLSSPTGADHPETINDDGY